jgi:hypothetical protein
VITISNFQLFDLIHNNVTEAQFTKYRSFSIPFSKVTVLVSAVLKVVKKIINISNFNIGLSALHSNIGK